MHVAITFFIFPFFLLNQGQSNSSKKNIFHMFKKKQVRFKIFDECHNIVA